MRITPFEELEELARERYRKKYADVPEPVPVNVEAVLAFTQPREFAWGGVGYRAPPVPFREGVRLLVAANALRELLGGQCPPSPRAQRIAVGLAARLLRRVVYPINPLLRLLWPFARRAFTDSTPAKLEQAIRWLLFVHDDTPVAPATERVRLDFMDALGTMVEGVPAWVGPDGLPLSWHHYVYASRYLSRARAREKMGTAVASRVAQFERKDFVRWLDEMHQAAGGN